MDSSGVVVRRATTSDATAIASVHVRAWQESYAHLVPADALGGLDVHRRAEVWSSILEEGTTDVRVAETGDGTVIGWASAGPGRAAAPPRPLELEGIYVLASWYGSGAGQVLLDTLLGTEPACLSVASDNPRSHAFYRRNGFRPDGVTEVYPMLGVEVDVVRLVR